MIFAAALSLSAAGCAGEDSCKLARATQLPLTLEREHLYTHVEVNDGVANMAVDTGSFGTLLTKEALARLKLPHPAETEGSVEGIGGYRSLSSLRTGHFGLGGLGGSNLTFSVPFGDWFHLPGDGILGMDILSRFDLDFDLPASRLVLYVPTQGCDAPSAALEQPLFVLPMHQNMSSPNVVIDVTIAGHNLRALLDSGSPGSLLFGSATRALGVDAAALGQDCQFTIGGVGQRKVAAHRHILESVQIGDLTISNMRVAVSDERDADADMLLGLDFFARVHLWLSFASHSVIMQYPPRPSPL